MKERAAFPASLRLVALPSSDASLVEQALPLAFAAYEAERAVVSCLPTVDAAETMRQVLADLFGRGSGFAAYEPSGALAGYLVGVPVKRFFGEPGGIRVPVHAHARAPGHGAELELALYDRAAPAWVRAGLLTHGVTVWAHDVPLVDAWFRTGFGMRCADAMRAVPAGAPESRPPDGIRVVEARAEHAELLAPLHRAHNEFYRRSPLFMHHPDEDPVAEFLEWIGDGSRREWAAFKDGRPVAFLRLGTCAENFASDHGSVRNIQGLYVENAARGAGIAGALVDAALAWCADSGFPRLGVNYETPLNRPASRFWENRFAVYTRSLVRRHDERVLAYPELEPEAEIAP